MFLSSLYGKILNILLLVNKIKQVTLLLNSGWKTFNHVLVRKYKYNLQCLFLMGPVRSQNVLQITKT